MTDIPTIQLTPSPIINGYDEALRLLFLSLKSCLPSDLHTFWKNVYVFWKKGIELKKISFDKLVDVVTKNTEWFSGFGTGFFHSLEKESETFRTRIKLNFKEFSLILATLHFTKMEENQMLTLSYVGEKEEVSTFMEQGMVFKIISEVQNVLLELLLGENDPTQDQQFYLSFLVNLIHLIYHVSKHPVVTKLFSCIHFWGPFFSLQPLIESKRETLSWKEVVFAYDTLYYYLKNVASGTTLSEAIKHINIYAATSYQLYPMDSHVERIPFQFQPPLQENPNFSPLVVLWFSTLEFPIPIQSSECLAKVVSQMDNKCQTDWFTEFGKTLILTIFKMGGELATDMNDEKKLKEEMKMLASMTDEVVYHSCQPLDYFQALSPLKGKEQVILKAKEQEKKVIAFFVSFSLNFFFRI